MASNTVFSKLRYHWVVEFLDTIRVESTKFEWHPVSASLTSPPPWRLVSAATTVLLFSDSLAFPLFSFDWTMENLSTDSSKFISLVTNSKCTSTSSKEKKVRQVDNGVYKVWTRRFVASLTHLRNNEEHPCACCHRTYTSREKQIKQVRE